MSKIIPMTPYAPY